MKRMLAVGFAIGALMAVAEGGKTNAFAEACCRAIDKAAESGAWCWQDCVCLDPNDAALQDELRKVLCARFPNEYGEALPCSGDFDHPKMKGLRGVVPDAVRRTETWRRIADYSVKRGYAACHVGGGVEKLSLAADPNGKRSLCGYVRVYGRTADVTQALRAALRKFRRRAKADCLTADEYYEGSADGAPAFNVRAFGDNGKFKFDCRHEMRPEPECAWEGRSREFGRVLKYAELGESVWRLLARRPTDYTFEEILKVLGKPTRSAMLRCKNCVRTDMRWTYEIGDADDFGKPLRHALVFSFASDGRCVRWTWSAE